MTLVIERDCSQDCLQLTKRCGAEWVNPKWRRSLWGKNWVDLVKLSFQEPHSNTFCAYFSVSQFCLGGLLLFAEKIETN